jgi:hypothetical protein
LHDILNQSAKAQRIADLIEFVQTNARGIRCGERHHKVRHANLVVDRARQLRASGMTYRAIGEALGVNFRTVWCWLTGRRRNSPAVRVVAKRRSIKSTATDTTSVPPPNAATPT